MTVVSFSLLRPSARPSVVDRLRRPAVTLTALVLGTRLVSLALALGWPGGRPVARRLLAMDGGWYAGIAAHGYPTAVPAHGWSEVAFFPVYPVLLRAVSTVTGLPVAVCTVLVSLPAGVGAVLVVRAVCARVTDEVIGHRAAVVWALLPQSWLFTFGYTEGLFVVLAGGTLLLGMRGRWGGAGLVAFVAGALRPTGIVLAAVAGWQAVRAPAGRRLRPLAVAAGALLGAGAFLAWIGWHTSRPDAWFAAERGGWRSGFDAGAGVVQLLLYVARYPLRTPWLTGVALTIAAAVWLCGRLCRSVRGPVTAYAVSVLALALTSGVGTLTSFPRMAYTAFPLAIPLARGLWRLPPAARGALLTVSAAASCALAVVIATSDAYVP